ncbi:hypothetical protein SLEP1_g51140 [Rubroshorea leprosula]|uniref:Uncharacterized protein n=1 Tax=Rubroshorea leprosula TaxID=152421 RepID=A0AAV5M282_9ROSI|nr:hypothetical protein SLEP1_g51140 [Rubroshorea leprosula]
MSSSSASPLSLFLTTSSMPPRRSSNLSFFTSPTSFFCIPRSTNPRILSLSSSFADANLDLSWFPPDPNSIPDSDGGWAVVEAPQRKKNKGLSTMVIGGIGSSVAIVLATVAYFSLYRRGFNFQFRGPLHSLHGVLSWNETIVDSKATDSSDIGKEVKLSDASPECESVASNESVGSGKVKSIASAGKLERIVVPVAADSTQEEALSVLKKLKV